MTTPNLDVTGHQWVAVMAGYDMTIEYLKENQQQSCQHDEPGPRSGWTRRQ